MASVLSLMETIVSDATFIANKAATVLKRDSSAFYTIDDLERRKDAVLQQFETIRRDIADTSVINSRLYGKAFGMLGDSYVKYSSYAHFPQLVADKYHMAYYNYGVAGSTIAMKAGGTDKQTTQSMVVRHGSMRDDLDYIGFLGGTNDANADIVIGDIDDMTEYTYCGAINLICDGLIAKYPNKKLFCVSIDWRTEKKIPYSKAFEDITARWGFPLYKFYRSEAHQKSAAWRNDYCYSVSNAHFNEAGHKLLVDGFESFMLSL